MKIEGQQTYPATKEVVWSLLHDPLTLEKLIPGCRSIEVVAPDEFRLTVDVRIGQVLEHLEGTLRFDSLVPGHSYGFIAEGGNGDGAINCHGSVRLENLGPELMTLAYEADIDATGRPATVSTRMLQTTARSFARRSLEALQHQVDIRTRVYTTNTSVEADVRHTQPAEDLDRLVIRRRLLVVLAVLVAALFLRQRADRQQATLVARQVAGIIDEAGDRQSLSTKPATAVRSVS